jgi:uncharacterized repeat protein (TIGR03803 family)
MNTRNGWNRLFIVMAAAAAVLPAQNFTSLASFNGANGSSPSFMTLAQGTDGNFYGATNAGGANSLGTVFQITPAGVLSAIYSFAGTDGSHPQAGLVLNIDANLYGTTLTGGTGPGTVFKISETGSLTTLHNFSGGADGGNAVGGLVLGGSGKFYGTTGMGGSGGNGTLFRITSAGALTTIDSFTGGSDGGHPLDTLVQAASGLFYGTTRVGGTNNAGVMFSISPSNVFTALYSLASATDGGNPVGGLAQGINQNLYGVAPGGGAFGYGTVFEMTPSGSSFTTLHSFTGGADGASPFATLTLANDGNFYGTTNSGGAFGNGTIFQITGAGALTTLYSFTGGVDGANPSGGLLQATDGILYGATAGGGTNGDGTVYSLAMGLPQLVKSVPHFGSVGSPVILLVPNLTGVSGVNFNGTPAVFTLVSPTEITTTVPAGATTGRIEVFANGEVLKSGGVFLVLP